jgi:hypothetical protein
MLDETEPQPFAVTPELVLVGHRGDDRLGELAPSVLVAGGDCRPAPGDLQPIGVEREVQRDAAIAVGAHDGVAQLVDPDAEVLDLLVRQPGATPEIGGSEPREPEEVGRAGDVQRHL